MQYYIGAFNIAMLWVINFLVVRIWFFGHGMNGLVGAGAWRGRGELGISHGNNGGDSCIVR